MAELDKINSRYAAWLSIGKKLSETHANIQWSLGDWLIDGETEFDFASNMAWRGIFNDPDEKAPSFWEDVAAETGHAALTLKGYAVTCRAYAKKDRVAGLGFTHHLAVAPYNRRLEYLAACIVPGKRPHTVEWLTNYARVAEGEAEADCVATHFVRFPIPTALLEKLKNIVRYRGGNLQQVMEKVCGDALAEYVRAEAKKIPAEVLSPVPKKPSAAKRRRYARIVGDAVYSERMRQLSQQGWDARRARVA